MMNEKPAYEQLEKRIRELEEALTRETTQLRPVKHAVEYRWNRSKSNTL
jgi:hypothetical protein